jgi:hypothetical protein
LKDLRSWLRGPSIAKDDGNLKSRLPTLYDCLITL